MVRDHGCDFGISHCFVECLHEQEFSSTAVFFGFSAAGLSAMCFIAFMVIYCRAALLHFLA
jgi:hypothetical protein